MILVIDLNEKQNTLTYDEFILPIIRLIGKNSNVINYKELAKENLLNYNGIILSGTPLMDDTNKKDMTLFANMKKTSLPIFGICAGMQIIAKLYGANLIHSTQIGMTGIKTTKENILFKDKFESYALHNLAPTLPKDFLKLAESKNTIQSFKHKSKNTYGVLFHPEVRNKEIIDNFLSICV